MAESIIVPALGQKDMSSFYRQYWSSITSFSVPLEQYKTFIVYCSGSGTNGIMDAAYGAVILVSNGVYGIIHKGTGITVSASGTSLNISSSSSINAGVVEM